MSLADDLRAAAATADTPGDELVSIPLTAFADLLEELDRQAPHLTGDRNTGTYFGALHIAGVAASGAGILVNGLLRFLNGDETALTIMRHEADSLGDIGGHPV